MEIILTNEQFRTLVRLLYLGEWVANSFRLQDESLKEYADLEQCILDIAEKKGFAELVGYEKGLKAVFPTRELEEEMDRLIDEYDIFTFWDKLADWMAARDFRRDFGPEAKASMDDWKRVSEISRRSEAYEKEFEKHGLDRLEIVRKKGGSREKNR